MFNLSISQFCLTSWTEITCFSSVSKKKKGWKRERRVSGLLFPVFLTASSKLVSSISRFYAPSRRGSPGSLQQRGQPRARFHLSPSPPRHHAPAPRAAPTNHRRPRPPPPFPLPGAALSSRWLSLRLLSADWLRFPAVPAARLGLQSASRPPPLTGLSRFLRVSSR